MTGKQYWVYILTNKTRSVLYIGVTGDISRRYFEHLEGQNDGFSKQYNLKHLVYVEPYESVEQAILREKQLKGWTRKRKLELIKRVNPELRDIPLM